MAKLTMFLVGAALLVTVNAFKSIFGQDDDTDADQSMESSLDKESRSMGEHNSLEDMDNMFSTMGDNWLDMTMPTMPTLTLDDVKKSHKECKPEEGCHSYSKMTSSQHLSKIVDGKKVQNTDDFKEVVNDDGKITQEEHHKH